MLKILTISSLFITLNAFSSDMANGKKLYNKINCAQCHNKDGLGKADSDNGKVVIKVAMKGPRIAGLSSDYILNQLKAIQGKDQSKTRKTNFTGSMKSKIASLSEADMKDISEYVSKELNPASGSAKGMLE